MISEDPETSSFLNSMAVGDGRQRITRNRFPGLNATDRTGSRKPLRDQPPKSSYAMFSGSTPRSSSILNTAAFIIGGPQM